MKIAPQMISTGTEQEKTTTGQKATGTEFNDILQETMTTSSGTEGSAMTLPPVQNIPTILFDQIQSSDTIQTIERVDTFVGLLEAYQDKLGDADSSLKDVSSLLSSMGEETEKILPLLDSLSDGDALKDILNRAVVTATVETIKYNRGDYL